MSLRDYDGHRPRFRFPRVSGDEPSVIMTGIARAFVFPA